MADTQQAPGAPPHTAETDSLNGRPEDTMVIGPSVETETAFSGGPQLAPPEETLAVAAEEGIGAWLTNKKIVRLWTNSSNKNAWIGIKDVGWRKLFNANESTVVCMTMLAAHARAENRNVNVRIESDNLVHEIYVW